MYLNFTKYCGFYLYYNRSNGLFNRIRVGNPDRIYERNLVEKIIKELHCKNSKIFLDIGSNIGLISLYALSRIPNLNIYAFEPGPVQNFLFKITIFANQIDKKIYLYNKALNNSIGLKKFISHNDINNSGDGFIDTERAGQIQNILNVETTTLDIWWNENQKPFIDVIKIDTEGAELWILEGGKEFLTTCKPTIFLEISVLNLKNYPYTYLDIYDWFLSHNFELYTINNKKCCREEFNKAVINEDTFIARPKIIY